ncbi:unnamed protein product [Rangifer tarandus platyrhynchus]|uniref:Uncharacterized protein n=1 Tax=Rangifer tarandus platyrhynchus TaxID=3082113 RepID=A0ABN9A3N4_RANTA|nr:unnamed protein product [Rangifer tarandus platyrhynchus]
MDGSMPGFSFTVFQNFFKFTSSESVMLSNHFILCCPLLLLPSLFRSIIVFSSESALCIRWPKYIHIHIFPFFFSAVKKKQKVCVCVYIYIYTHVYKCITVLYTRN